MAGFETVIGLEVHAQLRTESKIFCGCSTRFGDGPNENVCPVCAGMPGVLPVLNARVVEFAAKMGLAVECRVNVRSVFARKNYFYPDLPKGYQISQFELPLCTGGRVAIDVAGLRKAVGITRIHVEEDAGKNIHSAAENASFVDLNRTGVPLIEIVSEPDLRGPDEAVAYLKALRAIMVYLGICDGNMEEGSFRCDANVSVRPIGRTEFGTRAELKNLNSFKHVHKAIEYEVGRQIGLIEDGESVVQETRLFDADTGTTHSMRGKEEAHDYRYFPDPDLVPLVLEEEWLARWRSELPELPHARQERFRSRYSLPAYDAEILTSERDLADYFEAAAAAFPEPKKVSNWIMTELLRELNQARIGAAQCRLAPAMLGKLVRLVEEGAISAKSGKEVFLTLFAEGGDPEDLVKKKGLAQISDSSAIEQAVDAVLSENPKEVAAFRGGKDKLMAFFVGQVMRKTRGQANPAVVNELLRRKLAGG